MKILILTSIYKGPDISDEFTPIVHYFAKEWKSEKHDILVIHNLTYYHRIFYFISFFFRKVIANLTGTNIPEKRLSKKIDYQLDDINIIRLPIYKAIPYLKFKNKILKRQLDSIYRKLDDYDFKPDIIIGHWGNPQLKLLKSMKIKLNPVKTVLTLHYDGKKLYKTYKKSFYDDLNHIDLLGFRNKSDRASFLQNNKSIDLHTFLCPSGIPNYFTSSENININSNFNSFIFVGSLIKRKYPDIIIDALFNAFNFNFKMTFIGSGLLMNDINDRINKLNLRSVKLFNKLDRKQVMTQLDLADCFIMISEGEAFGLVYLEAMSRGCITICSANEGMDGIIIDGFNGFLCKSGNQFELECKLIQISKLSNAERIKVKTNAIKTAREYTDKKIAIKYLEAITEIL